jgi:diguanylate cyclase (GGDEF)-like protein
MAAITSHRVVLVCASLAGFVGVTLAFRVLESPGLGIGHFYYLPIALMALATNWKIGSLAGFAAAGLYVTGIVENPETPADLVFAQSAIRTVTFVSTGALIGWFASSKLELVDRLRDLAARDHLTGLLNNRAFEESLAFRCAGSRRFALLLGDLDGLKQINDRRGHSAGNFLLRRFGDELLRVLRAEDEVARVGGDEFAVLTSITVADEAERLCRRLEAELDKRRLRTSFGWALFPGEGTTPSALYGRADDRLYASKLLRRPVRLSASLARPPAARDGRS